MNSRMSSVSGPPSSATVCSTRRRARSTRMSSGRSIHRPASMASSHAAARHSMSARPPPSIHSVGSRPSPGPRAEFPPALDPRPGVLALRAPPSADRRRRAPARMPAPPSERRPKPTRGPAGRTIPPAATCSRARRTRGPRCKERRALRHGRARPSAQREPGAPSRARSDNRTRRAERSGRPVSGDIRNRSAGDIQNRPALGAGGAGRARALPSGIRNGGAQESQPQRSDEDSSGFWSLPPFLAGGFSTEC